MAFLFLFYGWYNKTDLPRLIGFLLIFLLGGMLEPSLPGSVEYQTGTNSTFVYGENSTLIEYQTQNLVYKEFQAHTMGFFIAITGVLGFIMIMVERRRREG